jgi:hypothetical protein
VSKKSISSCGLLCSYPSSVQIGGIIALFIVITHLKGMAGRIDRRPSCLCCVEVRPEVVRRILNFLFPSDVEGGEGL